VTKKADIPEGKLSDLAPTILQFMEIEKPTEMTGISLLAGHNINYSDLDSHGKV
jgi:bisphosphoglycerate-independent phosphoglycerate mutase (AlkP superfamily)